MRFYKSKIFIVLTLIVVSGLFTYTAMGGAILGLTLRTVDPLQSGLVGHWTFDGDDTTITSSGFADTEDLAPTTITGLNASYTSIAALDADSVAIAYNYDSISTGYYAVYNINGSAEKSPTSFEGDIDGISVVAIDSDSFAISYADNDDTSNGKFAIYNIDGTQELAPTTFETRTTYATSIAKVDSDSVAIACSCGSFGADIYLTIYNIDGTEEMAMTRVSSSGDNDWPSVIAVDSDSVAVSFEDITNVAGKYVVYNVSGASELAPTTFESGYASYTSITTVDSNSVAIAYADDSDSNKGKFVVYNTAGSQELAPTEFESGVTTWISVGMLDDDTIAVSFADGSTNGQYVLYNTSGSQELAPTEFESGNTNYTDLAIMDSDTIAFIYSDAGSTNAAKLAVHSISSDNSITANDSVGGFTGTSGGGDLVSGRQGQAMELDGVDDYIDIGTGPSSVKTIAFWIQADDTTSRKVIDIDGTDQIELNGSSAVTATSFPGTTVVYVDGVVASTVDTNWHHVVITDTTGVNASNLDIGRVASGYFDGKLDDVRMYDRVLSAGEVDRLYHLGRTSLVGLTLGTTGALGSGLVGHWTFDGSYVSNLTDDKLSPTVFEDTSASYIAAGKIDADSVAIAYAQAGGKLVVRGTDGSEELSETTFRATSATYVDLTVVDADSVAMSYYVAGVGGQFVVYNIDGTEELAGTTFDSGGLAYTSIASIDTDSVAIAYRDGSDSHKGKLVVYNISGSVELSETEFESGVALLMQVFKIDSDSVGIVYVENGAGLKYVAYNVNGTLEVSETDLDTTTSSYMDVVLVDSDSFAVAFSDSGDSSKGKFLVYNIDGTSELSETTFDSNTIENLSIGAMDTDSVVITYRDNTSTSAEYVVYNTDRTQEVAPTDIITDSSSWNSVVGLDSNTFVAAYYNQSDADSYYTVVSLNPSILTATDSAGSADGTNSTGIISVPGRQGQALDFNGTDDYIDIGTGPSSVKTIAFWMQADDTTSRKIIDIDGTDQIELNGSSAVTATSFPGTTVVYVDGAVGSTIDGTWHHVVITDTTGVNASNLDIGRVASGYFDGKLDDVRMYDRVLSAGEVDRLYHLGRTSKINKTFPENKATEPNLQLHYTFDGKDMDWASSTAETKDISGNGFHSNFVCIGSCSASARPGKIGQGFIAGTASARVSPQTAYTFPANTKTFSFWVKRDGDSSTGILDLDGTSVIEFDVSYNIQATNFPGTTVIYVDGEVSSAVSANRWHLVTVTDTTGIMLSDFEFGRVGSSYVDGIMDDLRFYDDVLTQGEIQKLYKQAR